MILSIIYWLGLLGAAIGSAFIKPGWRYVLACLAFIAIFILGMNWAMADEDGPVGFTVMAFHSLIFWIFLIANAIKWLVIGIRAVLRK